MTLADVLNELGIDIKNLDNLSEQKLYKNFFLKDVDGVDGIVINYPLSVEIDEDGDILILF